MGSKKLSSIQRFIVSCGFIILTTACQPQKTIVSGDYSCSTRASTTYSGSPESAVCTTEKLYSGGPTITAHAEYEYRAYGATGLSSTISTDDIRYAEFRVYKGSTLIQCGNTDTGTFTFPAPNDPTGSYTLKVYSRGDNSTVEASVLDCPEENQPYSASLTFSPTGSIDIGTVTAQAASAGEMVGAAFNIYDQIVEANIFLNTQLSNCSGTYTGCNNFTVAPKVQAYWTKGFNPNNYFGSNQGVSFYIPNYQRLFILGGVSGDVYAADTDHFDNSVILHEYGHFLEDVYTETDSPGGGHYGNAMIDPRLAWSEGWGNFIQAAIRDEPRYRDSIGTPNTTSPSSTSSYAFNILLETYQKQIGAGTYSCADNTVSGCDIPENPSEGIFREFSITRYLWDLFDSDSDGNNVDGETVDGGLIDIWASITLTDTGFLNSRVEFRNTGLLNLFQNTLNPNAWTTIQGSPASSAVADIGVSHRQPANTEEYAQYVTAGTCGKVFAMSPYEDPDDDGSISTSHRLLNNNFHHFYNPTRRNLTFTIKIQTVGGAGQQEPDVDLFLYKIGGNFGNGNDILGASQNYWDNNPVTDQSETFTISNLPVGHYLINPKIYTGTVQTNQCFPAGCSGVSPACICQGDDVPAGDPIEYEIEVKSGSNPGVDLCPDDYP